MKNLVARAQAGADPKRLFYDVQLKVRGERLVESFERIGRGRASASRWTRGSGHWSTR
jgi:hypothetical protein